MGTVEDRAYRSVPYVVAGALFWVIGAALIPTTDVAWSVDCSVSLERTPVLAGKALAHACSTALLIFGFRVARHAPRDRPSIEWHLIGLGAVITVLALTWSWFAAGPWLDDVACDPGWLPISMSLLWTTPAIALLLDGITSRALRLRHGSGWSAYWSIASLTLHTVVPMVAVTGL